MQRKVQCKGALDYQSSLATVLCCQPEDMLMVGKGSKLVAISLEFGQQPPPDTNKPIYVTLSSPAPLFFRVEMRAYWKCIKGVASRVVSENKCATMMFKFSWD